MASFSNYLCPLILIKTVMTKTIMLAIKKFSITNVLLILQNYKKVLALNLKKYGTKTAMVTSFAFLETLLSISKISFRKLVTASPS